MDGRLYGESLEAVGMSNSEKMVGLIRVMSELV